MTKLEMLRARLDGEPIAENSELLNAYLEDAEAAAVNQLYPFGQSDVLPDTAFYRSWVVRAALEMISRAGAEGQTSHSENGISRTFSGATVSPELLSEIIPKAKAISGR